jgi:hypothetical protein
MTSSKFSRRTRIQGLPPICKKPPVIITPPVKILGAPCSYCQLNTTPKYVDVLIGNMPMPWTLLAGHYILTQDDILPCTWKASPFAGYPNAVLSVVKNFTYLTSGITGLTTVFGWSVKDPTPNPDNCASNFSTYTFTPVVRWAPKMMGATFWITGTH